MMQLSDRKIKRLVWWLTAVICCLLLYFVCLPIYRILIDSNRATEGVGLAIALISSISFFYIMFFFPYVLSLFLIDCLRLSQRPLIESKTTGFFVMASVLAMIISPVFSSEKMSYADTFFQIYHKFVLFLLFPVAIILLSRFWLQKIKNYPLLLGFASLIIFNILAFFYLIRIEMKGEAVYVWEFFNLIASLIVCSISIIVNLIENNKMNVNSGRASK